MSNIYGYDSAHKIEKKEVINEEALIAILTNENSKSFFCENVNGKLTVTNESVKDYVLDSLYNIIAKKISRLDADYQEILKSKGDYPKYKHFGTINDTVKALSDLIKEQKDKFADTSLYQLEAIFQAHDNLIKHSREFKDSFTYDIAAVKQYYLVVVASIIYAVGYIVTTMVDYERRNTTVPYDIIFKNVNILERSLPKNMLQTIYQFNNDIKDNKLFKTIAAGKNKKPVVKREGVEDATAEFKGEVTYEAPVPLLLIGAGLVSLIVLLPLIRHAIYFFLHSKIKLSEYFEQQANFLELNIKSLKGRNADPKVIKKQEEAVEKMHKFAAKLSGDVYVTEREVEKDISKEDKEVVSDADKKAKEDADNVNPDFSDSDLML
jgi:hypothetical protein